MELKKSDKALIAFWFGTWVFAALLGFCGCEGDGMDLTQDVPQGNIGQAGVPIPPATVAAKGRAGMGAEVGVLQFRGDEQDPRIVTVAVTAFDGKNAATAFGPMVGIARWGAGNSGEHSAEFDVPGRNYSQNAQANFGFVSEGGGVLFTVPASSIRVTMRNDGSYIPPIGDLPIGFNTTSGFGMAALGVGDRPGSNQLFRTIYAVNASAGNGLGAAASQAVVIPPFAKTARVVRIGPTAPGNALNIIQTGTAATSIDSFAVAANALCPEFAIAGGATFLSIKNTGADEILTLAVIYSIGI